MYACARRTSSAHINFSFPDASNSLLDLQQSIVMAYHCWYCGESSEDYEFYQQHQVTPSFTVEFPSGDCVVVHRATEEDGGCK